MPYEPSWSIFQLIGYWQTLIAGVLAVIAAAGAVYATISSANREIAAAMEQTRAARDQIVTSERLELQRILRASLAFLIVVEAAARRVLEDVPLAKAMVTLPPPRENTTQTYSARQRMRNPVFADIRRAIITEGPLLIDTFLHLDKAIEDFAEDWTPGQSVAGLALRLGTSASFHEKVDAIQQLAEQLRDEAATAIRHCRDELERT